MSRKAFENAIINVKDIKTEKKNKTIISKENALEVPGSCTNFDSCRLMRDQ